MLGEARPGTHRAALDAEVTPAEVAPAEATPEVTSGHLRRRHLRRRHLPRRWCPDRQCVVRASAPEPSPPSAAVGSSCASGDSAYPSNRLSAMAEPTTTPAMVPSIEPANMPTTPMPPTPPRRCAPRVRSMNPGSRSSARVAAWAMGSRLCSCWRRSPAGSPRLSSLSTCSRWSGVSLRRPRDAPARSGPAAQCAAGSGTARWPAGPRLIWHPGPHRTAAGRAVDKGLTVGAVAKYAVEESHGSPPSGRAAMRAPRARHGILKHVHGSAVCPSHTGGCPVPRAWRQRPRHRSAAGTHPLGELDVHLEPHRGPRGAR